MRRKNLGLIVSTLYPDADIIIKQDHPDQEPYIYQWDESLGQKPDEDQFLLEHENEAIETRERKIKEKENQQEALRLFSEKGVVDIIKDLKIEKEKVI